MAAGFDEPGLARVKPAVLVDDFPGRLLVLEIAPEDPGALDEHLPALCDPHVDAGARAPGRRRVGLGARLERGEAGRLGGAGRLLVVHAEGPLERVRVV